MYGAVYTGFALGSGEAVAWALFFFYGTYHGLAEGAEKAVVARLAPAGARGRALGLFALALGVATLIASLSAGLLYKFVDPSAAFGMGAVMALAAVALLALWSRA